MREEYDFSDGIKNLYVKPQKTSITIRIDTETVDYFKKLSAETSLPYQTLMNAYLTDCAVKKRKLSLVWDN